MRTPGAMLCLGALLAGAGCRERITVEPSYVDCLLADPCGDSATGAGGDTDCVAGDCQPCDRVAHPDCCSPAPPMETTSTCADAGGETCAQTELCLSRPFVASDASTCCNAGDCFDARGRVAASAPLALRAVTRDGNRDDWLGVPRWPLTKPAPFFGLPTPDDLSGQFAAQWDDDALYVLVEVTDDLLAPADSAMVYNDDSMELFVDLEPRAPQRALNADLSEGQIFVDQTGAVIEPDPPKDRGWGAEASFASDADDDWWVEVELPWPGGFPTPSPGQVIGFDVAIDDDDAEGDEQREAQIFWSDPTVFLCCDARHFGLLRLLADDCSTEQAVCGDGACDAGEGCVDCADDPPWCFDQNEETTTVCPLGQCLACPADCAACS